MSRSMSNRRYLKMATPMQTGIAELPAGTRDAARQPGEDPVHT